MKRILITGAAGFIGANLAKALVEDHVVIGFDNLIIFQLQDFDSLQSMDRLEDLTWLTLNSPISWLKVKKYRSTTMATCIGTLPISMIL